MVFASQFFLFAFVGGEGKYITLLVEWVVVVDISAVTCIIVHIIGIDTQILQSLF